MRKELRKITEAMNHVLKQSESNISGEISTFDGSVAVVCTLICLICIDRIDSFAYAYAAGTIFYVLIILLALRCFNGLSSYLASPFKHNNIPIFIGKRLDVVFSYPVFLLAIINILNRIMVMAGSIPDKLQYAAETAYTPGFIIMRLAMLPIVALSEELLNLIIVSSVYNTLKPLRQLRLPLSILIASALFGLLHSFAWGGQAALNLAVSFVPVFVVTLFTGSIWISTLAHLYNDIAATAGLMGEVYSLGIYSLIVIVPAVWAVISTVKGFWKN